MAGRLGGGDALAVDVRRVHAHEPLAGGAVDQRRLVAPAVHVAVFDGGVLQQRANFCQLVDDDRVGLPHIHAAEERQVGSKAAIALHRRQDVLVVHAVLLAGVEVVQTVGRRGVHDAGTGVETDIVGNENRRQTVVQRMAESNALQRRARTAGNGAAAEAIARETGFLQVGGKHQTPLLRLHQVIGKFRVHVERLVAGNGPGRGGPDDGPGLARRQLGQPEGSRQLVAFDHRKSHIDGG